MRTVLIAAILFSSVAGAAMAQSADPINLRVNKLEREMRAVQRKVFPNGVALEPEIGATPSPTIAAGTPASNPITDLSTRVDTLEAQLRTLTGHVETDGNRIRKLEEALLAYEGRLKALEPQPAATDAAIGGADPANTGAPLAAATPAAPVATPGAGKASARATDPARKELIDAVEIPATGDAIEDAYTYGYRLWQAKLYPEAQVKFKDFVARNPGHKRASYAQNLLGRAYLDEGKPALASVAFYDNYQKMPKGERAAESLYWLGIALTRLKKPADACKVYVEFDQVYAAGASAELISRVAKGKTDAKCAA
jgi:TolA-binding protein